MGVTLVPLSVLETFPNHTSLSVDPLCADRGTAWTVLIKRKGVESPNLNALLDILAESMRLSGPRGRRKKPKG